MKKIMEYFSLSQVASDLFKKVVNLLLVSLLCSVLFYAIIIIIFSTKKEIFIDCCTIIIIIFFISLIYNLLKYAEKKNGSQGLLFVFEKNRIYYYQGIKKGHVSAFGNTFTSFNMVSYARWIFGMDNIKMFCPANKFTVFVEIHGETSYIKDFKFILKSLDEKNTNELFEISCNNINNLTVDEIFLKGSFERILNEAIEDRIRGVLYNNKYTNLHSIKESLGSSFPNWENFYDLN